MRRFRPTLFQDDEPVPAAAAPPLPAPPPDLHAGVRLTDRLGHWKYVAFLALATWLVLFGVGMSMDSGPYREALNATDPRRFASSLLVTLLVYTPTNVALLCGLAGFLGAVGGLANLHEEMPRGSADTVNPFVSGVLRGCFLYLVVISGLLVLTDNPFGDASPENYVRLAGFISLGSFVVSYNPRLFATILSNVDRRFTGITKPDEKPEPGTRTVELTTSHVEAVTTQAVVSDVLEPSANGAADAAPAGAAGAPIRP